MFSQVLSRGCDRATYLIQIGLRRILTICRWSILTIIYLILKSKLSIYLNPRYLFATLAFALGISHEARALDVGSICGRLQSELGEADLERPLLIFETGWLFEGYLFDSIDFIVLEYRVCQHPC